MIVTLRDALVADARHQDRLQRADQQRQEMGQRNGKDGWRGDALVGWIRSACTQRNGTPPVAHMAGTAR